MDSMEKIKDFIKSEFPKSTERRKMLSFIGESKDVFKKIDNYYKGMSNEWLARNTTRTELKDRIRELSEDSKKALYSGNYFSKKTLVDIFPSWEIFITKGFLVNMNGKYKKAGLNNLLIEVESEDEE